MHSAQRAASSIERDAALHDARLEAVILELASAEAPREKTPLVLVSLDLDLDRAAKSCWCEDLEWTVSSRISVDSRRATKRRGS
jgi:hypothetical protein